MAILVDFCFSIAYTSASNLGKRVLKSRNEGRMELSERKKKILSKAVEEYIRDCSPITSGGIKDIGNLDCSTATLRNELNALEAMGFLRQLHTSGGRVPTAQGYRFYVENLLTGIKATNEELDEVRALIEDRTNSLSDLVTGIAKIVSKATNYPTVVLVNGLDNLILTEFKIIPLIDEKVMVLVGTNSGYITDTLSVKATGESCTDASAYLTKHFRGESIGFMIRNLSQLSAGMQGEISEFQNIVDSLVGGLQKFNSKKMLDVRRGGAVKLLKSGDNLEETQKVLELLEDEDNLVEVLEEKDLDDITISVADDDQVCSVVKAPIKVGGAQLATIGVIGPQRMDYEKIASALKVVIENLSRLKGD